MNSQKVISILENTMEAILVHDGETPLFYNQNFLSLFEFSSGEEYECMIEKEGLMGRVYHEDIERVLKSHNDRVEKRDQNDRYYTVRVVTKKDKLLWVDVKTSSIEWNNDTAVMVSLLDSTEIINKQNSNNNIQRLFEHVLSTMPIVITLTSIKDGIYHHVSDMFETVMGYSKKSILGISSYDLNIWPYENERLFIINTLKSGLLIENFSCSLLTKNNKIIPVTIWARIVESEPENLVLLAGFDRTEEVDKLTQIEILNKEILATQKQLIQSSKMASIGTMTAGVAHEINNPTNFAHAASYMMHDEIIKIKAFLKQLAGGDKAEPEVLQSFDEQFTKLIELTKTASEGTTRIKAIVEDLRTFARIDDSKQAQVQVTDLINSTVHLIRTQYDSLDIGTQFDYKPIFTCFPSKLNQVFMNIIINACQAIEHKKSSKSKFEGRVIISTAQHNKRLIITFEDNGRGMTEQTINRIFEPFYTTKGVGSGTGLGMAISFSIIEEHGGNINVESAVEEGTKITIGFDV